jgi:hypothetical protein
MERINNQGKAHAVIALIEELSKSDYISPRYIREKLNLLFTNIEWSYEEAE